MFLAPGTRAAELANFVGYCLAYTAATYGIQVHASVWMSNHHHTDVTDPDGNLVSFKQLLHSLIARGRNAKLGRDDGFWSPGKPCDTPEPTEDESLRGLVYTLTNPVDAGLVKWARLWPGFTTAGWRFGETRTFKRPDWFFNPKGDMPEEASLTLARPPIFPELDDNALYEKLAAEVRRREVELQEDMRKQGRRFMGPRKVTGQSWRHAPKSFKERFTITPKVVAVSRWQVLAELQRDRDWERRYAIARELFLAGKPAVFPAGTYWMRRFAGVDVAERPP